MLGILRPAALCFFICSSPCFAQAINSCVSADEFKAFQEKNDAPLLIKAERVRPVGSHGMQEARERVEVGGVSMTRAEAMEAKYVTATHAEERADKAITQGRINANEKSEYISTARRLLYLEFKQYGYVAGWIGFAYSPKTAKGALVMRDYQITEKGDVLNNGKICFMDTLSNVRYLLDNNAATQKLAEEHKTSSCDAELRNMGYGCGSLYDAVVDAYKGSQGLILFADSASSQSVRFAMTGRPETGALFLVSRQGTANKISSLFDIKIDPSLVKH